MTLSVAWVLIFVAHLAFGYDDLFRNLEKSRRFKSKLSRSSASTELEDTPIQEVKARRQFPKLLVRYFPFHNSPDVLESDLVRPEAIPMPVLKADPYDLLNDVVMKYDNCAGVALYLDRVYDLFTRWLAFEPDLSAGPSLKKQLHILLNLLHEYKDHDPLGLAQSPAEIIKGLLTGLNGVYNKMRNGTEPPLILTSTATLAKAENITTPSPVEVETTTVNVVEPEDPDPESEEPDAVETLDLPQRVGENKMKRVILRVMRIVYYLQKNLVPKKMISQVIHKLIDIAAPKLHVSGSYCQYLVKLRIKRALRRILLSRFPVDYQPDDAIDQLTLKKILDNDEVKDVLTDLGNSTQSDETL